MRSGSNPVHRNWPSRQLGRVAREYARHFQMIKTKRPLELRKVGLADNPVAEKGFAMFPIGAAADDEARRLPKQRML